MAKNKKVVTDVDEVTNSTAPSVKVEIVPLNLDFGREDLNQLAAKVNEVIEKVNK